MKRPIKQKKRPASAGKARRRVRAGDDVNDVGVGQALDLVMAALHRRAEAQVRKKPRQPSTAAGAVKASVSAQRLLHELQVHQVELEMQNSELHEARDRMDVLLEKYTDLYDFAPVGYLSLDEQGRILETNLRGAALLGMGRARLVNQRLLSLVVPASRPHVEDFLKRIFAGAERQVCEATLLRENAPPFIASLQGSSAFSVSGPRSWCRVVISDISALKQAEAAQQRLAAIVEYSQDSIIGKDLDGGISSWNKGAEKIFGYSAREMVGSSIMRLIPPDRQAEEALILNRIRRGESVQNFETLRLTKQGRLINVSITSSPIRDAGGKIIGASTVARDISDQKRAESILRQNAALVSALVSLAPVGVYVVDARFRVQQLNPRARPVFKNVRPLLGRDFSEAIHLVWPRRVADHIVERFRHTLETGEPYVSTDFSARRRDTGVTEFYEWQIQRIILPDDEFGVVCFFSDITERKHAEDARRRVELLAASNRKLESEIVRRAAVEESLRKSERQQVQLLAQSHVLQEQLRQLSRKVLRAQEEERKRISRELHDVIAQTLTGINISLAALKKKAGSGNKGFDHDITRTQRLVEQSVDVVHEFARELRPTVLDDLGLIPALHAFVKIFSRRTNLPVCLKVFAGVETLDISKRTVLFRVAQEALANVARHARAGRVELSIQKRPDGVCMKIRDDGRSFSTERPLSAHDGKSLGLLGMKERLEMVGGSFGIESAPGKGTTIIACIPQGSTGME